MNEKPVLVVDDERNIRLTISRSLEDLQLEVETAVNGEEALAKLEEKEYALILLDLKMPGMNGMEVLRLVEKNRPEIPIIIISAHGTIDSAVEAMKLGAVDFLQKPFAPQEIRDLVSKVLDRGKLKEETADDYRSYLELAKKNIGEQHFETAQNHISKAIALQPDQAEAFNLLGALLEIKGDRLEAQKQYRVALDLDPTYKPAQANLDRSASWHREGRIILGEEPREQSKEKDE